MDEKILSQLTGVDENEQELSNEHSGFEHYCDHFDDEEDTFLRMVLEAQ